MKKSILRLSLIMALCSLAPLSAVAVTEYSAGVMEIAIDQEITISYSEGYLTVTGAEGLKLEVYALTSKVVMEVTIDSPSQRVELNLPKGCYIVKVGKVVRKVSVR